MKIAIIGSRGIPNQYGGLEQFAEFVSSKWVEMGHEVICYNPSFHPYKNKYLSGVEIKKVFCPEKILGPAAHFIYDYLSLRDAVKNNCDIFLELGYQSSAFSFLLFRKKIRNRIVTNMDGLEWMRSKWSPAVKYITKISEKIAVKHSARLISDNQGIADYFKKKYNMSSDVIAYGSSPIDPIEDNVSHQWLSDRESYDLIIARLEPENNVETIINAYIDSGINRKLIVVGGLSTKYARDLTSKYKINKQIIFIDGLFDQNKVNSLRQHSTLYFHGHSVGGTNPSLIEAMANKCRIIAHDNIFNRAVLGESSFYFKNSEELKKIIKNTENLISELDLFKDQNLEKIKKYYLWEYIAEQYISCFNKIKHK